MGEVIAVLLDPYAMTAKECARAATRNFGWAWVKWSHLVWSGRSPKACRSSKTCSAETIPPALTRPRAAINWTATLPAASLRMFVWICAWHCFKFLFLFPVLNWLLLMSCYSLPMPVFFVYFMNNFIFYSILHYLMLIISCINFMSGHVFSFYRLSAAKISPIVVLRVTNVI